MFFVGKAPNSAAHHALLISGLAAALFGLVGSAGFAGSYTDVIPTARLPVALERCDADQFCTVKYIDSRVAANAGIKLGDQLRLDSPIDFLRIENFSFLPGERVGAKLRRNGATSHVEMAVTQGSWTGHRLTLEISDLILLAVQVSVMLVGVLLLIRSRDRTSTRLLGTSLIFVNAAGGVPVWLYSNRIAYGLCYAVGDALSAASPLLLLAFAFAFRWETTGNETKRGRLPFMGLAAITAVWSCVAETLMQLGKLHPLGAYTANLTAASWFSFGLAIAAYGMTATVLAAGWREAPATDRPRYRYIVPALVLLMTMQVIGPLLPLLGGWDPAQNAVVLVIDVLPLLGLLMLVYGVLRHRVIDLGFAVNRTLVYGAVSAMLLGIFGLTEWAVDHFIPVEGREKNALVDAAIGLVVFLTFHRVRDFVEEAIERLFFNRWHHAETQLRRFLQEGAFFTEPGALSAGFVHALTRYADGAPAALYVHDAEGYRCVAGEIAGIAPHLSRDLHALVRLRAKPQPAEVDDAALTAAVIAPMVNRNEVIGFAMLGAKPSGEQFRPDEIELIGTATRQVGQDLQTLKIERLERDAANQRQENSVLKSLLSTARLPIA